MKKIHSINSTKPQEFLYTDFSVVAANNYKASIQHLFAYIDKILKFRDNVYISLRDIQEMYESQSQFFYSLFNINSGHQLWYKVMNKKDQKIKEDSGIDFYRGSKREQRGDQREIIGLLTKIIIGLTKQKNECAQNKRIDKFAQIKTTIQWIEVKLILLQKQIRQKKKQIQINQKQVKRLQHQKQFRNYENYLRQSFDQKKKKLEAEIVSKHQIQRQIHANQSQNTVRSQHYIYRPSLHLRQAKDISLLAKLAPYKSQKKRPYQAKIIQSSLDKVSETARNKMCTKIQNYKKVQMHKLLRKQKLEKDHKIFKIEEQQQQIFKKAEDKIEERRKYDKIQLQKFVQQNNKVTSERLNSLKKSLNHYSMHDQSRKIRDIIHKHRETIQFVNDIDKINRTQRHSEMGAKDTTFLNHTTNYQTLDPESNWNQLRDKTKNKRSQRRYGDQRVQRKLLRKIKRQGQIQISPARQLGSSRKSLIQLYDSSLNQVLAQKQK